MLLLLLGGAILALVYASIPARALDRVSTQLAERRSEIGPAMALTVALGAGVLVVLVVT